MTITKEQAKEIAVARIRDRKPNARADQMSAGLTVREVRVDPPEPGVPDRIERRPIWDVSPSALGDVSWHVAVDAISGEIVNSYVLPN